jgi:pSer/pThr/pTyr-binding forkhead associated (FHA) protein
MAKLIIHDPHGDRRIHELVDDVTTIGRGLDNILRIDDGQLSRNHCRIEKVSGDYRLIDPGSSNGTFVNGTRIQQQTLRPGDELKLGGYRLVFDAPVAAPFQNQGATMMAPGSADAGIPLAPVPPPPAADAAIPLAPVSPPPAAADPGIALAPAALPPPASGPEIPMAPPAPAGGKDDKPVFVLEVIEGKPLGKLAFLTDEPLSIGRDGSNGLAVEDDAASGRHAEVSKGPAGFIISDLGSSNRTRVNGEPVFKAPLSVGDTVQIGSTVLIFKNIGAQVEEQKPVRTLMLNQGLDDYVPDGGAVPEPPAGKPVGKIVAAVAVLGVVAVLVYMFALKGDGYVRPQDDLVVNGSFDGGVTAGGDPVGWRTVRKGTVTWEVLSDTDRLPRRSTEAALVVSRSEQAPPGDHVECVSAEPVPVDKARAYRLGGWIRTETAKGAYGFRVYWQGENRRSADQVYLAGTHREWSETGRTFAPPAWAMGAEVACFAYGNTGKIFFDDVSFAPAPVGSPKAPAKYDVSSGDLRLESTLSGTFDVTRDGTPLATSGELFIDEARKASTGQRIAAPREPKGGEGGRTFAGTVPCFTTGGVLDYSQRVSPGDKGLVVEYEVSSDPPLQPKRAGVRLTVSGGAPARMFDDEGTVLPEAKGDVAAREVLFQDPEGGTLALFCGAGEAPGRFRVTESGEGRLVEVLWPEGVGFGAEPSKLAFEINTASRVERRPVERLWEAHKKAREAGDVPGECGALEAVTAFAERFPDDAAKAKEKLAMLDGQAGKELHGIESRIAGLEAASGEERESLRSEIGRALGGLRAKYPLASLAERARVAESKLADAVEMLGKADRDAEARELLERIAELIRGEDYDGALTAWERLKEEFAGAPALEEGAAADVPGRIESGRQAKLERLAVLEKLKKKIAVYRKNKMFGQALKRLEADPDFKRHAESPEFKQLHEEVRREAEAAKSPPAEE